MLHGATGIIDGIPDVAATANFTVKVSDSEGHDSMQPLSITITGAVNTNTYTLAVTISPSIYVGSVNSNPAPINGVYLENIEVTLNANPANGYHFDHWEGPVG